jgi:hypothetical protein
MEVTKLIFNNNELLTIKNDKVEKMEYHEPRGEGDKHYVDAYYTDGTKIRFFIFDSIEFQQSID